MSAADTLPVLRIAVVGHTNAGKTSLLRTLLRDVDFGDVSSSPGTTRDVIGCALIVDGREVVKLYDTPGLEDSIGLLEELERHRSDHRADGLQLVHRFLQSSAAESEFAQEAKALRSLLECDAALYVVDARDPVLAKNRDELRILGCCAKPVVPVLNFVATENALTGEWREQLARVNMHAVAEFDTVVLEADGEMRLFEKMQTLLDAFRPTIRALMDSRRRERAELIRASARSIVELLIDVAALSIVVDISDQEQSARAMERLKEMIRDAERRTVAELLQLHRFRESDYIASALPVEEGEWGIDLFSPEALQEYGVRGGAGAAAGAMIGLTLDIMLGGLSLGAATALGAAIGAAIGAGRLPGKHLLDRIRGRTRLRADESTLTLLTARQIELVIALLHRGHAGREPIALRVGAQADERRKELARIVRSVRPAASKPQWSRIDRETGRLRHIVSPDQRERVADQAATSLAATIASMDRTG